MKSNLTTGRLKTALLTLEETVEKRFEKIDKALEEVEKRLKPTKRRETIEEIEEET
jgi:hypothetical protein